MWHYSRLANLALLANISQRKRAAMKRALTHRGNFAELLQLQKEIVSLAFLHLRRIALPASVSCAPILLLLWFKPEMATLAFFVGFTMAYGVAKWRWKI